MFLDATDDCLPWFNALFPALLTARKKLAGAGAGGLDLWQYEWKEQVLDPATWRYTDVPGGRVGTQSDCPALEVNNVPTPDGTLVWMRFRAIQQGTQVYEFRNPLAYFGTFARLTGYYQPGNTYSWAEVYRDTDTSWATKTGGLTGTHNAREASAAATPGIHADPSNGTVVWLWLAWGDDTDPRWVFFLRDPFWATLTSTSGDWTEWDDGSGLGGGRTSAASGLLAHQVPGAIGTTPVGAVVWLELDRGGGGYHFTGVPPLASGHYYPGEGPVTGGLVSASDQSKMGSWAVIGNVYASQVVEAGDWVTAGGAVWSQGPVGGPVNWAGTAGEFATSLANDVIVGGTPTQLGGGLALWASPPPATGAPGDPTRAGDWSVWLALLTSGGSPAASLVINRPLAAGPTKLYFYDGVYHDLLAGGGIVVGGAVTGGTPGYILQVDGAGDLGQTSPLANSVKWGVD